MARGSGTENDVLVIGLGRFGAAAALELRRLGHKVTAIEKDGFLAEKFLGRISHVIHGDASDVAVIRDAKAGRFPIAVVAIGSSVEASVLAAANLVDAGVADTSEETDWDELLRLADQRLLAAKRAGRDRVLATSAHA